MGSSPKRVVLSSEGLITQLQGRFKNGLRKDQIVQGLEEMIERLKQAGLIISQGGGSIRPTLAFFTKTYTQLRDIADGKTSPGDD